jgi:hypothetical protein
MARTVVNRLFTRMRKPGGPKLFFSYAWKDDQPFGERLYRDLEGLRCHSWMDKRNMPSSRALN